MWQQCADTPPRSVASCRPAVWRLKGGAARSASAWHLDALQQLRTNLCRFRCQVHGRKAERMTLDDDCLIDHRSNGGGATTGRLPSLPVHRHSRPRPQIGVHLVDVAAAQALLSIPPLP